MTAPTSRGWLAAVGVVALAGSPGCVLPRPRADHALIGAARPPHAGPVRLAMEGTPVPPPGEFEEVAVVSATGWPPRDALPEVLAALQARAAQLGCQAVIRVRHDRGAGSTTATGVAVWLRQAPP